MNIALVGNPNSGKTSLFNLLTGSNQYVGNWPGVTVEKKKGSLKKKKIRTFTFKTYPVSILCLLIHPKK
ncbi:50S ribosome-binding GTPase [Enterococcus faecium]|nr:50S ribosome-binding GTPase [Enterococcus faecium]